jgi:recombination protein RecR
LPDGLRFGDMKPVDYPEPFRELARELRRLPGIGPRTAERIALWMVSSKDARPLDLAGALRTAAEGLRSCAVCGFFATEEECEIATTFWADASLPWTTSARINSASPPCSNG